MVDLNTRTVSLQSSNLNWDIIDERAKNLGLDRSKYTQQLYELEMKHDLMNNKELLKKKKNKFIDIVIVLLLIVIISILMGSYVLTR